MKLKKTNQIEKIIKDYEKARKGIENKYKERPRETSTMKKLKDINEKIAVSNLRIKNLQEELSKVSVKDKDLVEEYANSIKNIEHGYQDEKTGKWIDGKDDYLKTKEELEKVVASEKKSENEEKFKREKEKELELNELDDKTRVTLTQELKEIDINIERCEVLIKANHIRMQEFEYEYEEYEYINADGKKVTGKTVKNGEDFKRIYTELIQQQDELIDLRQNKKLCEDELDKFRQRDEEKMKAFSKAWNATEHDPDKSGSDKKEPDKDGPDKKGEDKNKWHSKLTQEQIDELKAEGIKPGDPEYSAYLKKHGISKKEPDKDGEDKNKWHPKLTQEQIDELKAEGIKPGDPEYDMYLKNHGINEKGTDKKEPNKNKWHPKLTQEQIDELKAEGIEPGDSEYDMYLKNHGINEKRIDKNEPDKKGEDKNKWHPKLTQEQIDELKAEGIKPGDPKYDMYLRNHGINEKAPAKNSPSKGTKCSISIGREGIIEYDGKKYEVSKEDIKDGVNINSFDDDELEEYLKTDLGIKNEVSVKTFKNLIKKDLLDMTVVHAIFSTNMENDKKRDLITRYANKVIASDQSKEDSSNIDLEYNMENLSKSNFLDKIFKKEVNATEKMSICRSAIIAKRHGIAKMKGEYKPSLTERIAGWIKKKQNFAFPVKDVERAYTVASEYNKMAYDKDGKKVQQKELQKKFKERLEYNEELEKDDKDRLSFRERGDLKTLVKAHDETEEQEEEK